MPSHSAGTEFRIRDYRPSDFEAMWHVDQRCFPPGISYSRMELSSFITRRHAVTLIGELPCEQSRQQTGDGQMNYSRLAGFVIAHPIRQKYGRILTLDIVPEARRFGLATTLMTLCEQRLRSAGCADVYLETAVDNEAALRLYQKLGYSVLRTLPDYYSSHSLDAFLMGKRL